MTTAATPETGHKDNLFGICNALGEDFGFNPLWLRIVLAASFIFAPVQIISGYFAVGAAVLVSRLLFPKPKADKASAEVVALETPTPAEAPVEYARAA